MRLRCLAEQLVGQHHNVRTRISRKPDQDKTIDDTIGAIGDEQHRTFRWYLGKLLCRVAHLEFFKLVGRIIEIAVIAGALT